MLCEQCGVNPAVIHVTSITNGEKLERHLCSDCMLKYQKDALTLEFPSLEKLFSSIMDARQEAQSEPALKCRHCGLTYGGFKKTGLLGCAQCYVEFRKQLEPVLNKMHGRAQHVGRVPKGMSKTLELKRDIDSKRNDMTEAVVDERFEEAAHLRDTIRNLEGELERIKGEEASGI